MKRRVGPSALALAVGVATLVALVAPSSVAAAQPGPQAAYSTTNTAVDGSGHCHNGNEDVNCNQYDGKQYVWTNGGAVGASLGDGTYMFSVLAPGGQANPNDGDAKNLSDDFDAYTNRVFTVSGGAVSYSGSHDVDGNKIRLAEYADTPNNGGVYILAICSLGGGYPVDASTCKYDAFMVQPGSDTPSDIPPAHDPTIVKDAAGSYDTTFGWGINKAVDKTTVKQVGGSATFNYTVTVSHDAGTTGNVKVTGTITVSNTNVDGDGNTLAVAGATVSDQLSDGTVCAVTNGADQTLSSFETTFAYSCDLSGLPAGQLDNTATVAWPSQALDSGAFLAGNSANFIFHSIQFTETQIDECATVSDSFAGSLGTDCVGGSNPTTSTYGRTIAIPTWGCSGYDNTASFATNDRGATGSSSQSVRVCGPVKTGALTIGFWQNKNGQDIVKGGAATSGTCNSGAWLRQYAPFQDLSATASCTQVATYVTNVIKAANASGASMNAMLKAQMLASSLDVYFSDPALGGNKIGASSPIGAVSVDLTQVCTNIAACSNYVSASAAFGGAGTMTVSQALSSAAGQSNVGGSSWYGNVKVTQELAKDVFDAINNQVAFAP